MDNRLISQLLDDELDMSDPDIAGFVKKATTQNVQDIMVGNYYVNTMTPQEMTELKMNIRNLLKEGVYTYQQIESYFIKLGYAISKIRKAFEEVTGICVDRLVTDRIINLLHTPPSIPSLNLAYGKSKLPNYNYLFLMPWVHNTFCVFGQSGDITRDEVKCFLNYDDAVSYLKNNTEDTVVMDDKVVLADLRLQPVPSEPSPDLISKPQEEENPSTVISKPPAQRIPNPSMLDPTLYEEMNEVTPQDFFNRFKGEKRDDVAPDVVAKIIDFLNSKKAIIPRFTVDLKNFKYTTYSLEEALEHKYPETTTPEFFNTSAIVSVILEFIDRENQNNKFGLIVFLVADSELSTTDTFKGEDGRIYALTEDGLASYFATPVTSI